MAQPTPQALSLLKQAIYYHLDNGFYDNATFLAQNLLNIESRCNESVYLLALCHLRSGQYRAARDASKNIGLRGIDAGCAYVYAQACLALEEYQDGIMAIERCRRLWSGKTSIGRHSATTRAHIPDAAAFANLLGKLYRGHGEPRRAISAYEEALKQNPLMWDAFTDLCDMGVSVRVPNLFKVREPISRAFGQDQTVQGDSKSATSSLAVEALSRKPGLPKSQTMLDLADPFSTGRSVPSAEASGSHLHTTEAHDAMARAASLRSSRSAGTALSAPTSVAEPVVTTPTGQYTSAGSQIARALGSGEGPQAPSRRTKPIQPAEAALFDGPPRIGYKLGAKRIFRAADRQGHLDEDATRFNDRAPGAGLLAADRKRTASGHPATQRAQAEEQGAAGQRRSARLNFNKPPTRANAAPAGALAAAAAAATSGPAGRELRRARPPIARPTQAGPSGSNVYRAVSGNRKPPEDSSMDVDQGEQPRTKEVPQPLAVTKATKAVDNAKLEESLGWILDMLRRFGQGYLAHSQFKAREAELAYESLPTNYQSCPWALALMGRVFYEQADYPRAEQFFKKLRQTVPARMQDMELYSTVLWFLRREAALSFLAHELVDADWHSPQAWCALGNAWSLSRDAEMALKCFRRATQLDPSFAYAFTLQGHEHVASEEYERAVLAYRNAISADQRHYNAYYGIGRVYERLGSLDRALTHYRTASSINPNNAVLVCCIGTILERQQQMRPAIECFTRAVELAPSAPQTRYKRARALLATGRVDEARDELMELIELAPDEATVHFLLGKLYKMSGDKEQSVRHYTWALNLDPKAAQRIKSAMESLQDEDPNDSMME